ncbi:MAG: DUF4276 family protein [Patescibacteria group bacterium]
MKRILVLVEGQTEERFVKDILNPFFEIKDMCLHPTIVNTKIVKSGPNFKGGLRSYEATKKDLLKLFHDTDAVGITTMFDFYGLPTDFPGFQNDNPIGLERVKIIESAFASDINKPKFIPYIQLHEFEGLLFTTPEIISNALDDKKKNLVQAIRDSVTNPEEINQGRETAPSKRLLKIFPNYNKVVFGSMIANRIGLEQIKNSCPHFSDWIEKLLAL